MMRMTTKTTTAAAIMTVMRTITTMALRGSVLTGRLCRTLPSIPLRFPRRVQFANPRVSLFVPIVPRVLFSDVVQCPTTLANDDPALSDIADAVARGSIEDAHNLFWPIRSDAPLFTWDLMLRSVNSSYPDLAVMYAQALLDHPLRNKFTSWTWRWVIQQISRMGRSDLFDQLAAAHPQQPPPWRIFLPLFMSLSRMGRPGDIEDYVRRFIAKQSRKLPPRHLDFHHTIIKCYSKHGMVFQAEHALQRLMTVNTPTILTLTYMVSTYGVAAKALSSDRNVSAPKLHNKPCRSSSPSSSSSLDSNQSYTLAELGERIQNLEKSMIILDISHDVVSFSIFMRSYLECGDVERALNLFNTATSRGIAGDAVLYTTLIKALGRANRIDDIFELLHMMQESDDQKVRPTVYTYSAIMSVLLERDDAASVPKVFAMLMDDPDVEPNEVIYGLLLRTLAVNGRVSDVMDALEMMKLHNVVPNQYMFSYALKVIVKEQNSAMLDKVWRMISDMEDLQWSTVFYNTVIDAMGKCNRVDRMWEVFEQMKMHQQHDPSIKPDLWTVNSMLRAFADLPRDHWTDVQRLVEIDMPALGLKPNERTFTSLVKSYSRRGNARGIMSLLKVVQATRIANSEWIYATVLSGLGKIGDMKRFERVRQMMVENGIKSDLVTLTGILSSYRRARQFHQMLEIQDLVLSEDKPLSVVTYTVLFQTLGDTRRFGKLAPLYRRMCDEKPNGVSVLLLNMLASALVKSKDPKNYALLLDVFAGMGDKWQVEPDLMTYRSVLQMSADVSRWRKFYEVWENLLHVFDQRSTAPRRARKQGAGGKFCKEHAVVPDFKFLEWVVTIVKRNKQHKLALRLFSDLEKHTGWFKPDWSPQFKSILGGNRT